MQKAIIKKFNFLKMQGFNNKIYFRNGDSEIYYTKNKLTIEVHYCLSTLMQYCLEIIVDYNGKRENIFNCDFFDKAELNILKSQIESLEEPLLLEKTLDVYADFIKNNI